MAKQMVAPESEEKIEDMFDRIAPTYDLLNRLLSARQDEGGEKNFYLGFQESKMDHT